MTVRAGLAWFERMAIGVTPAVGLSLVALGLHIGAGGRTRGVVVYGRAPGVGRRGLALQIVAIAEEGGVRELIASTPVDLRAGAHGESASWSGSTNADGVAEAWLDLPAAWGEEVMLRTTSDDGTILAEGSLLWPSQRPNVNERSALVAATRASGPLALDVLVRDEKLVPGARQSVLVRVTNRAEGHGVADATVTASPDQGLSIESATAHTSSDGWARFGVTADFLIAGWSLDAKLPPPNEGTVGSWFGALPVAAGGASTLLPVRLRPATPYPLSLVVPPATRRLYVEVDDTAGCDFAAALDTTLSPGGANADVTLPALAKGAYWLVTSSDSHGAETLSGTTLARPFRVDDTTADDAALEAAGPFMRFVALDGLRRPRELADKRRRRGLALVFTALVAAAGLEATLLLRAAARARTRLQLLSAALDLTDESPRQIGPRGADLLTVLLLVLMTVLGLAVIGALALTRGM